MFYTRSKTCTVDECAELCKKQKGCNYFIVGNGEINGVNKTGAYRSERSLLAGFEYLVTTDLCCVDCRRTMTLVYDDRLLFLGKDH